MGLGLVAFAVYVATALVLLRVSTRRSPALLVTASGLAVYAAVIIAAAISGRGVPFWPLSATYWFLALSFLMGVGAIYKSISLRILLDLLNQPGWAERYEVILNRYVQQESYHHRLSILVGVGCVVPGTPGYDVTPKGRRLAIVVHALQRLFKIECSG